MTTRFIPTAALTLVSALAAAQQPPTGGTDGGIFQGTANIIFEGSRTGDTITATLRLRWSTRGTNTAPNGTVFDNVESGTYSVTLRKTGEKNEGGFN